MTPEPLGQRIARLRAGAGWTQQELADRIAISRVAVSHLEMGISVPSERTVTLLAGVFHVEPTDLVDQTSYPAAKAERLPLVTARYTEVEHQIRLMRCELAWAERLTRETGRTCIVGETRQRWLCRLAGLASAVVDPRERRLLADARAELTD